jgi:hypothetical protein
MYSIFGRIISSSRISADGFLPARPDTHSLSCADTLNIQWAYLRDNPPTGPVIGHPSKIAPPLPWANREAVLRRDAAIRAIREETQRARTIPAPRSEADADDSRQPPRMNTARTRIDFSNSVFRPCSIRGRFVFTRACECGMLSAECGRASLTHWFFANPVPRESVH